MNIIKNFPILYRTTKNTYQWQISVLIDNNLKVFIKTEHGVVNGKSVPHLKEIKKAKSKKTKEAQAIFEATSKWQSKIDKEGYSEDVNNKTLIIRPMLAHTLDLKKVNKKGRSVNIMLPCYCQRKYDGIRCLATIHNNKVLLISRKGKEFCFLEHIKKECMHLLNKLPKSFYLDGELYTNNLTFQEITGLCRLSKSINEERQKKMMLIEFHIYDCFDLNNLDQSFDNRTNLLQKYIQKYHYLVSVPTEIINIDSDIKTKHQQYVSEGFEGLMLRNISSKYELNKRSKHLQKYKEFMDEEFKIIDYKEGVGGAKGTVIWVCETKKHQPFSVRPVGTTEHKRKLFENGDKYLGKLLTVVFQEYTNDGLPRFPVGKAIRDPNC